MKKILLSELMAIVLLVVGFAIMIIFIAVFIYSSQENFSINTKPDTNLISQFGDIIGGLTGSLWALAGVVLFYLALESQKVSYELNRKSFDKQIETLNMQIVEFKAHGDILKRTAIAQEKTQKLINEEISLEKIKAKLDLYSSLANIHSDLARLEDTKTIKARYKEEAAKYMAKLKLIINDIDI